MQLHVRIVDTDRLIRDKGLLETTLVSSQTFLLQRVDELELVDAEITHKAGHELLEEFLKVCEVLAD